MRGTDFNSLFVSIDEHVSPALPFLYLIHGVILVVCYRIKSLFMTRQITLVVSFTFLLIGNSNSDVYTCIDKYGRTHCQQSERDANTTQAGEPKRTEVKKTGTKTKGVETQ